MKKLTILLVIVLALLVSGCGITPSIEEVKKPNHDEQKVIDVMYKFISAISAENFNKAKSLCVEDSEVYDIISYVQDIFEDIDSKHFWVWNIDTITCSVYGKSAIVYLDISGIAYPDIPIPFVIEDAICYLEKFKKWKIYGQKDLFLPWPEE